MFETARVYRYTVETDGEMAYAYLEDHSVLVSAAEYSGGWRIMSSGFDRWGETYALPSSARFKVVSCNRNGFDTTSYAVDNLRYFPSFDACVEYIVDWFCVTVEKVNEFREEKGELIRS